MILLCNDNGIANIALYIFIYLIKDYHTHIWHTIERGKISREGENDREILRYIELEIEGIIIK